jgi:hypothetical protein
LGWWRGIVGGRRIGLIRWNIFVAGLWLYVGSEDGYQETQQYVCRLEPTSFLARDLSESVGESRRLGLLLWYIWTWTYIGGGDWAVHDERWPSVSQYHPMGFMDASQACCWLLVCASGDIYVSNLNLTSGEAFQTNRVNDNECS